MGLVGRRRGRRMGAPGWGWGNPDTTQVPSTEHSSVKLLSADGSPVWRDSRGAEGDVEHDKPTLKSVRCYGPFPSLAVGADAQISAEDAPTRGAELFYGMLCFNVLVNITGGKWL